MQVNEFLTENCVGREHEAKSRTSGISRGWRKVEEVAPVKYDSNKIYQRDRRTPKKGVMETKGRTSISKKCHV